MKTNNTTASRLIALLSEEVRLFEMREQIDGQIVALRAAIQEVRNLSTPIPPKKEKEVKEDA